jgi:hypothetical protein
MPLWEHYDIEVELTVKIKADSETVAYYTVPGFAKAGSNEKIDKYTLLEGVDAAVRMAANRSAALSDAIRLGRRKELGYGD